ncbi:hypothetical protein SteCoe_33684 [Stentor coeruleus]|uniref:Flavin reductase like domain-containing protein n=1 Tax=Stentor coeruleus TaxID=5963 RepID=A0A1R2AW62_9CILI|nr:hypothetical protein SteCoe_33684 [Stentor coeruleus]
MDKILRQVYAEFRFPVGIMTTVVKKNNGMLIKGDLRGCTISSFRVLEDDKCFFSFNKTRIMASALDKDFAFHYLISEQMELAKKFSLNGMSCEDQFTDVKYEMRNGLPVLMDYHSLVIGTICETLDVGDCLVYIGKVEFAECLKDQPILHYKHRKFS